MKLSKPSVKYRTISLSEPIVNKIREIIEDDPSYRSTTSYVNQALREKMQKDQSKAMEKEPVVRLSKSELTDMIRNVVTEILDKKEKK